MQPMWHQFLPMGAKCCPKHVTCTQLADSSIKFFNILAPKLAVNVTVTGTCKGLDTPSVLLLDLLSQSNRDLFPFPRLDVLVQRNVHFHGGRTVSRPYEYLGEYPPGGGGVRVQPMAPIPPNVYETLFKACNYMYLARLEHILAFSNLLTNLYLLTKGTQF